MLVWLGGKNIARFTVTIFASLRDITSSGVLLKPWFTTTSAIRVIQAKSRWAWEKM